jgi:replicative DNA helicase
MSEARYQSMADLLDPWRDDVHSGKPPTLYPVGTGELARIGIGPGLVTLVGGAPGAGKTALTLQWVLDALSATPSLKALILNVEMSPSTLLDRQLARLADIDGSRPSTPARSSAAWKPWNASPTGSPSFARRSTWRT